MEIQGIAQSGEPVLLWPIAWSNLNEGKEVWRQEVLLTVSWRKKRWLLETTSIVCKYGSPPRPTFTSRKLQIGPKNLFPEELMSQDQSRILLGSKSPDSSSWRRETFLQGNTTCSEHQGRLRKSNVWPLRASTRAAFIREAALSPRMPETVATHVFPSSSWQGRGGACAGRIMAEGRIRIKPHVRT